MMGMVMGDVWMCEVWWVAEVDPMGLSLLDHRAGKPSDVLPGLLAQGPPKGGSIKGAGLLAPRGHLRADGRL